MTSRERVIAAIEFAGPDRLPHRYCYLPAALTAHGEALVELLRRYPSDFAGEDPPSLSGPVALGPTYTRGQWTDEWGCTWTVLRDGFMGQVTVHPLADLKALRTYRPPRVPDVPSGAAPRQDERYLCVNAETVWEKMVDLMGYEEVMYHLGAGSPELLQVRDMVVEHVLEMTLRLLASEPDAIYFSDDWGTQRGIMVNPQTWREIFLPSYRRLFEPVRAAGKHVFFHTDGYTLPILPDLVEAGANVFWADLTVNGTAALDQALGGKVCFQGLTDVQFIVPHGTPEEVFAHTRTFAETFGKYNGGFIACHEADPDQPLENIAAAYAGFFNDDAGGH